MRLNDMRLTEKAGNSPAKPEALQALIDDGADPNARDKNGEPALKKAADAEKARVLLANGADPHIQAPSGFQPIHEAARQAAPDKVRLLLEHGADPEAASDMGDRPMHQAMGPGGDNDKESDDRLLTVDVLVAAGADPDIRDDGGWPPLATVGGPRMALRLIDHGADPEALLTYPTPNVIPGQTLPEGATVRDWWLDQGRNDILQAVDARPAQQAAHEASKSADPTERRRGTRGRNRGAEQGTPSV